MPNPNTIPWLHYQDIQIPDVTLQQQFKQYVLGGQYNQALALLTTNEQQLQGKAYIANTINTIASGILDLESRFNNGVTLFLSDLATQYNDLIINMKKAGTWNANTQYVPYNFVIYNQQIYMCLIEPPIGILPTSSYYWLYLGLRGETGAPGVNVTMQYDWNNGASYQPNDLVVYDNNIYVALKTNSGVTPGTDETTWLLFLVSVPGQIFIGTTAPQYYGQNTVWFQTQVDPLQATDTTPIVGLFNRYNTEINDWEPMYPNTLFTWLDNTSNYAPPAVFIDLTIQPNMWNNFQYIYAYPELTETSWVDIYPVTTMTSEQLQVYNELQLSFNGQNIVLTISSKPTVSLPIIIKIQ